MSQTSGTLARDWFSQPCPSCHYQLQIDKQALRYSATVATAPSHLSDAQPQAFYERLWEHDVAELFLADRNTGHYLEINLAPNGAWWGMQFSAPRQRLHSLAHWHDKAEILANPQKNSWSVQLRIPIRYLQSQLPLDELAWNSCFILGAEPRQYISAARLDSKEPDFHRPENFRPL